MKTAVSRKSRYRLQLKIERVCYRRQKALREQGLLREEEKKEDIFYKLWSKDFSLLNDVHIIVDTS